jgi:hypothetical protein
MFVEAWQSGFFLLASAFTAGQGLLQYVSTLLTQSWPDTEVLPSRRGRATLLLPRPAQSVRAVTPSQVLYKFTA